MPSSNDVTLELLRQLLCSLGDTIRERVIEGRRSISAEALSSVASHSIADTIYEIDKFGEEAIREWFDAQWPASEPVEVSHGGTRGTPLLSTRNLVTRTPNGNACSTQSTAPAESCMTSAVRGRSPVSRRNVARRQVCPISSWRQ